MATPSPSATSASRLSNKVSALAVIICSIAAAGCTTGGVVAEREAQAFEAGRNAERHENLNVVFFNGWVRNPAIEWREGLTLREAILNAIYTSHRTPSRIQILSKNGEVFDIDPETLLQGEDYFLEPGDTVTIER